MKSKKCPVCKKEIKGWNKKMIDYNMRIHIEKHERDNLSTSTAKESYTPNKIFPTSDNAAEVSSNKDDGSASHSKEKGK